jgi:hypothetical protein
LALAGSDIPVTDGDNGDAGTLSNHFCCEPAGVVANTILARFNTAAEKYNGERPPYSYLFRSKWYHPHTLAVKPKRVAFEKFIELKYDSSIAQNHQACERAFSCISSAGMNMCTTIAAATIEISLTDKPLRLI